jgi:mRNA interferase HigB
MRVRLVRDKTILNVVSRRRWHTAGFTSWLDKLKYTELDQPSDILDVFPSADILGKGSQRVIFNIGGNKYRLICRYYFGSRFVHLYDCWLGTHAEYDILCKKNLQYTIRTY